MSVKLLPEDQEWYVLAQSQDRVNKERAMRRRQLEGLWQRLKKLQAMKLKRDEMLNKLGSALHDYLVAARLIQTAVAPKTAQLTFSLPKDKLRQVREREGHYPLRSNMTTGRSPEELWQSYLQRTEAEAAFKSLMTTWCRGRSITNWSTASILTFSSLFWPTVCAGPCAGACVIWRLA
jgi:hypothetical protein